MNIILSFKIIEQLFKSNFISNFVNALHKFFTPKHRYIKCLSSFPFFSANSNYFTVRGAIWMLAFCTPTWKNRLLKLHFCQKVCKKSKNLTKKNLKDRKKNRQKKPILYPICVIKSWIWKNKKKLIPIPFENKTLIYIQIYFSNL